MPDLYTRETIRIPSVERNVFLDVWQYKPSTPGPHPLVVAGHGMSVIKDAGLAAFGERWAQDATFASLILDYRHFGDSDGQPRNLLSLKKQQEDYQSVIQWARERPELFKSDKIVVMGSAMSGLTCGNLILEDPNLAGAMAHCPVLDGYATLMSLGFNPRLLFWAAADATSAKLGLSPRYVRAVGKPGELAMLNTPSSYDGFTFMFSQGQTPFSASPNVVTPRAAFELLSARPGLRLKEAQKKYLVVMSREDDITPAKITRSIAAAAPDNVILVEAPGGHYEIMRGGEAFETNINAQVKFLKEILERTD